MAGDGGGAHDRQMARLLRILELSGGRARFSTGMDGSFHVSRSGRDHGFTPELVTRCCRDGLLSIEGDRLVLDETGLARLRRMQFPDTAFLSQHAPLSERTVRSGSDRHRVTANDGESPLSRLARPRRGAGTPYLTPAQFAAGERLRADFERGRLQPRVSASWDRPLTGGGRQTGADLSDFALDARRRVERALDCLEPELAGVALDVCCFLKGLEQVERERRWPPRSAKLMLRTALSVLGRHYGLEARASGARRALLHWGDESYRPAL